MNRAEFVALLRARARSSKLPRRLSSGRVMAQPDAQRRAYFAAIKRSVLADMRQTVEQLLIPELPRLASEARGATGKRADAGADDVEQILRTVAGRFFGRWSRLAFERIVQPHLQGVAEFHAGQMNKRLYEIAGVDVVGGEPWLEDALAQYTAANVSLIRSIPSVFFDQIETLVTSELAQGARWESIVEGIHGRFDVSESRAKLIARDQAGKLYGALNEVRQIDLGIETYTWRTMRDNRVRDEHEARDGKSYPWDKPPAGGHPGRPVLCRCYPDPDVDAILAAARADVTPSEAAQQPSPPPAPTRAERLQARRARAREASPLAFTPATPGGTAPASVSTVEEAKRALAAVLANPGLVIPRKGWKYEREYMVPLAELQDVVAYEWEPGRVPDIERGYRQGKKLPPIKITEHEGLRDIVDGNHRLAVARRLAEELGIEAIPVRFSDRQAAQIRLRERGTSVVEQALLAKKAAIPAKPPAPEFPRGKPIGDAAEHLVREFPRVAKAFGEKLRIDDWDTHYSSAYELNRLPDELLGAIAEKVRKVNVGRGSIVDLAEPDSLVAGMARNEATASRASRSTAADTRRMTDVRATYAVLDRDVYVGRLAGEDTSGTVAVHELGHAIDHLLDDKASEREEFLALWRKFKSAGAAYSDHPYFTRQGTESHNATEVYAEAFAIYMNGRNNEWVDRDKHVDHFFGKGIGDYMRRKFGPGTWGQPE